MSMDAEADKAPGRESCGEVSVDFAHFDLMVDGPDSPCVEIYRDFLKATEASLAEIRQAALSGDRLEIESIAHQLKGASASLGLTGFSARMKAAEEVARSGGELAGFAAVAWLEQARQLLAASAARIEAERGIGA